jgi:Protein kinase domain
VNRHPEQPPSAPSSFPPSTRNGVPASESELIDRIRADAIRCFREFLLVPTIGRYAKTINPSTQPLAAREVVRQVLESCDTETGEVAAVLFERYPRWSAAIRDAQSGAVATVQADDPPSLPASCGPTMPDGGHRFTIGPRVAAGSGGVVHWGEDRRGGADERDSVHRIIVKLLPGDACEDESWRQEAELAATVGSPCGIRIIDAGIAPTGHGYIVMERVDGLTLIALAASEQMAPPRHAGPELAHLADALEVLHERGLGHGDIHPANVMFDRVGHLRLLDYGNGSDASANDDVRSLCALSLWMTLGYVPPPGVTVGWQWSPMRAAVVEQAVDALNTPRTAGEFARRLRDRMRRARLQRNTLTTLLMGLLLAALMYLGTSSPPSVPGPSHAAGTNAPQSGP